MDKEVRSAIERATQRARKLLEDDYIEQLEGTYDVLRDGRTPEDGGRHLDVKDRFRRDKIIAAVEHKKAAGMKPAEAVLDYLRDAAFTTLNRFVALKMLESRELVQPCISTGEQSAGYKEFGMLALGVSALPGSEGYRLFLESIFDELSTEIKVLFDRRDVASVLWPRRQTFEQLLGVLNAAELSGVWGEDETIGWVYQYFNSPDERRAMRDASQAPRNSRELAIRNQFFTPRYVVQFLADNTLGRLWYEMRTGRTALADRCEYLVRRSYEAFQGGSLDMGVTVGGDEENAKEAGTSSDSRGLVPFRAKKDPRDIRVLDPACGSGHFLLYAFGLLLTIYEECWEDVHNSHPPSEVTGQRLRDDYPERVAFRRAIPALILRHNLYGVEIDPRCAQIAQLALWMRAQRAFRTSGVVAADRSPIDRINIVLAEPMPGDTQAMRDFVARLADEALGHLFQSLTDDMRLAGQLGALLRIEQLVQVGVGKEQLGLFSLSEQRIRATLERYVAEAGVAAGARRRLFADDVAHGLGLIDLVTHKFDVVLINPPFGDAPVGVREWLQAHYGDAKHDLACCFLRRAVELAPGGMCGAITSRTIYFLPTSAAWRKGLLGQTGVLSLFVDLGLGVLDDAMVETALVVLGPQRSRGMTVFVDVNEAAEKDAALRSSTAMPKDIVDTALLLKLPAATLCYWALPEVLQLVASWPPLAESADARQGLATTADFRMVRAWYEFERTPAGWCNYAKGGEYQPFVSEPALRVNWVNDGREIKALVTRDPTTKHWSRRVAASEYYGRPGLTWSERTDWLSLSPMPRGSIFGVSGKGCFDKEDDIGRLYALAAVVGSRVLQYVVRLSMGERTMNPKFQAGDLQRLPLAQDLLKNESLRDSQQKCVMWHLWARTIDETSMWFAGPYIPAEIESLGHAHKALVAEIETINTEVAREIEHIEALIVNAADLSSSAMANILRHIPRRRCALPMPTLEEYAESTVQWLFGVVMGRWGSQRVDRKGHTVALDPFAPVGGTSPAMRKAEGTATAHNVLVDDPGHKEDVLTLLSEAMESVGIAAAQWFHDVGRVLTRGEDDLRGWLATSFFDAHLIRYSAGRRRAPIYWQFATASAGYSVWIYVHACTRDTLYAVQRQYIEPKLLHEDRKLIALQQECGPRPTASQRNEVAEQEIVVEELRALLEEVRRVASLWNPKFDDGVIINFALLWRLVPHNKAWQAELKETWDALRKGEYDWAHLAMHLWPERVVPKCAEDRSVAIAHDLEEVFWLEGADGRWKARSNPTRSVEELVKERTSPAVKAALRSLLDAPAPAGATKAAAKKATSARRRAKEAES